MDLTQEQEIQESFQRFSRFGLSVVKMSKEFHECFSDPEKSASVLAVLTLTKKGSFAWKATMAQIKNVLSDMEDFDAEMHQVVSDLISED